MKSTARPNPKARTTPIAESRSRARWPSMPNKMAANAEPTNAPIPTLKPVSSAKDAPVRDNSLDPCTAKDICRMTMNGPTSPASNASRAAANNACWTKSRRSRSRVMSKDNRWPRTSVSRSVMIVPARVAGVVDVLADDDVLLADLDHLDVGAVELGERGGRHHLGDGTDSEPAVDQVQHAIHVWQNGIQLMGDEQYGGLGLAT